jgi:hypothetical protein
LGFTAAIGITTVLALVGRASGWIILDDVIGPRPATAFIYTPDKWSFILDFIPPAPITPLAGEFDQLVDRSWYRFWSVLADRTNRMQSSRTTPFQWLRTGSVGPWRVLVGFHQC